MVVNSVSFCYVIDMPGAVWNKALELANEQYGFVTAADLRLLGEDPVRLRQWKHRGVIDRVARGVYRFPQVPVTPLDPYMLATLWPEGRGVLSHDTALALHDLCDINPSSIHITLPPSQRYRPRREGGGTYVVHHDDLDEAHIGWHEGIRIVVPAVAIRQGIDSGVYTHLLRQAIAQAGALGRVPPDTLGELGVRLENRT